MSKKMFKMPSVSSLSRKRSTVKWGKGSSSAAPKIAPVKAPKEVKEKAAAKPKPALHYSHVEDLVLLKGASGLQQSISSLEALHSAILSGSSDMRVSEKMDGSPSLVFGYLQDDDRFFVATKAFFNKVPKINHSVEDIRRNYGHSEDLCKKLEAALLYLPEVCRPGRVFQGDLLFASVSDLEQHEGVCSFCANTVTYTVRKGHRDYAAINMAYFGLCVFAELKLGFGGVYAHTYDVPEKTFLPSSNVFVMSSVLEDLRSAYYPVEMQRKFADAMQAAQSVVFSDEDHAALAAKSSEIMRYINNAIRLSKVPNAVDCGDDMGSCLPALVPLFEVHAALTKAKDVLSLALSVLRRFSTTINGDRSKGEGFVFFDPQSGEPIKIVDRTEFSRLNFQRNEGTTHVLAVGRMNPPTHGHERVINAVLETARKHQCGHSVFVSSKHDPVNNPLSVESKMDHLRTLFPGVDFVVSDADAPNFLHHVTRLYREGVRHLILVAGSDRLEHSCAAIEAQNGHPDYFRLNQIDRVSSGKRDEDSISATAMREYVREGSKQLFLLGLPSTSTLQHSRQLYDELRSMMSPLD